jgi:hypothetical protein
MTIALRQSTTSQEIALGYFVDSTDGNTEETGLTINNTDIKLWKNGATTLANKNSGGATHISNGVYYATLDDTDTNTLGPMIVFVHVSGALSVRVECEVLPANVFDSIYSTDRLQVDLREIGDANLALSTQMKADVNAEVDTALDTAVPGSPTSNSINERVKTMDDAYTSTRAGYLDNVNQAGLLQLTTTRAAYLDNLSAGAVALASVCTDARLGHLDADISSRSSHSAADVWAVVARTLTDYSGVWSVATRALTDKAGFSLAADQSAVTVGTVNALTTWDKTGYALSAAGVDAILDETLAGHSTADSAGLALKNLLKIGKNKWDISGTTFTIYDDNGTSALYQFTLDSGTSPTVRTPV